MVWLVDNVIELTRIFATEVATSDPVSALLIAVGGAVTAGSLGLFGLLAVRGVVAALTRD